MRQQGIKNGIPNTLGRIWDRDHYSAYHAMPSQENRERLIGLAVAERTSQYLSLHRDMLFFA